MESCFYLLKRPEREGEKEPTLAVFHSPSQKIVLDHATVSDYVAWVVRKWGGNFELHARHDAWAIQRGIWHIAHAKVAPFSYADAVQWAAARKASVASARKENLELRAAS